MWQKRGCCLQSGNVTEKIGNDSFLLFYKHLPRRLVSDPIINMVHLVDYYVYKGDSPAHLALVMFQRRKEDFKITQGKIRVRV